MGGIRFMRGDCRSVLASLPADSVYCCVTSPPYWGLRDYGIPPTVWGGEAKCKHAWGDAIAVNATNHTTKARWNHTRNGRGELQPVEKRVSWLRTEVKQGNFCRHCNAWRGAHGLEPTIDLYVRNAVDVFREVRRVLRPDGTLWLNLGDSYSSGSRTTQCEQTKTGAPKRSEGGAVRPPVDSSLKPKDLCGIPWRVAFALQADGWWLRQDIIWAKPNPMPESVTDRCTKAHEYVFLLTKSARYFFDAEAIKETAEYGYSEMKGDFAGSIGGAHAKRSVTPGNGGTRNKRSVWEIPTSPFPEAHFATFPPVLVEPCIKAGCPKGGTVLDPFGGAGTTGLVADRLQRNAILIELGAKYVAMARRRIANDRRKRKPKIATRRALKDQKRPPKIENNRRSPRCRHDPARQA